MIYRLMNSISSKDREEINTAIFHYLKQNNYPNSAEMF